MDFIKLEFKKDLTKLAGNPFGQETYDRQVKEVINFDNEITFIFPERIDGMGSSFVQGFFSEIVKNIGISGVRERIFIQSSVPDAKNFILHNLEI